jgi:formylglycine-generating enzyme required for sulfatase activity
MVALPAGTFRMGTDYDRGFPADGEGPVRSVSLAAFDIDTYAVTNADFAAFVESTGFRTEAEVFEWSFVFWSHIPPERFDELVEDTAAPTPCGARFRAQPGITLLVRVLMYRLL